VTNDASIQYRPTHTTPGKYAYDDDGQLIPVEWPSDAATCPEVALMDELLDMGAQFPNAGTARAAIEQAFDRAGDVRAAEALAFVLARLPGGRRGAELRAALLGRLNDNGQEMADQFGTSRQSWHQRVDRLRAFIFEKR